MVLLSNVQIQGTPTAYIRVSFNLPFLRLIKVWQIVGFEGNKWHCLDIPVVLPWPKLLLNELGIHLKLEKLR